ncbi:MAG: 50S ribosomal protein L23 [Dehalococcoidia bacterium]|nr:50S ribosomal protein L23 [Dehalococcoidia bacterium]
MKAIQVYDVLRKPIITEKSTILQSGGKYAFEVAKAANKTQIKDAVEKAFKVTVISVNVMVIKGKLRRVGRGITLTPSKKKAIVTLKAGDKIEMVEGV